MTINTIMNTFGLAQKRVEMKTSSKEELARRMMVKATAKVEAITN